MRLLKLFLLLTMVAFFQHFALGQALQFSLEEARSYAVENSFQVKSAEYDLDIAAQKVKETLSYGLPQIDAVIDYSYFIQQPSTLVPDFISGNYDEYIEITFGTKNNANFGITLNQMVFDGRYIIGMQYVKVLRLLSEQGVEKSEIDIQATITETYYSILVGMETLKILDSTMSVLKKMRYETNELYLEGFVEETDVDQLTLTITDIENNINLIGRQNDIAYEMLKYQMGVPIESEVVLTENLDDVLEQINAEVVKSQEFKMAENIDYKMITAQEEMKLLNLRQEKAYYYPALSGYANYIQNAQRESFTFTQGGYPWFPSSSVGLSMNIPILSSGMRKAKVGQAKIELDKIRLSKEQLERGLKVNVETARMVFNAALENYYREKQNVELSLKIYRKALVKYSEGVTSSAEMTQQHNQFFDAESRYFQTVLALLNAKNELDKTLGNY